LIEVEVCFESQGEGNRMSLNIESLSNNAKTVFLARLSHALTISERETYEVGTERVLEPEILRAYNELLHRVAGAVANHLEGVEGYSLESFWKWSDTSEKTITGLAE
jgi:hypothetical protein